jgi:hypothetical protein
MMLCTETVATWNNFEFGVDMKKEKILLEKWDSHINSLADEAEAKKTDNRKVKKEENKAKKAAAAADAKKNKKQKAK